MLYDSKKWDRLKDIWSLESLAAWLDQQPPEREYTFTDGRVCAAAQYLQAMGITQPYPKGKPMSAQTMAEAKADPCYCLSVKALRELGWNRVVNHYPSDPPDPKPYTFGAAAKRAKKLLDAKVAA